MKQSDKYYVFGNENWLPQSDLRAPAAVAGEIPGLARSIESYYAEEHALQIRVTDEERANADSPIRPDTMARQLIGSLSGISNIQVPGVGYNSAKPNFSGSCNLNKPISSNSIRCFKTYCNRRISSSLCHL